MNALSLGLGLRTTVAIVAGEGETEYLTDEDGVFILDENGDPIIVTSPADPNFAYPGDYSTDDYAHSIIFFQSRDNYPIGTIWKTMGGNSTAVRAEDPSNPRDKPYSTLNQDTGAWGWFPIADRGTKWEFVKE